MIHIALIPDGNRRFAEKAGKPRFWGHAMGIAKMHEFIDWVLENDKIDMVSAYALSHENLSRPDEEKEKLWDYYKEEFFGLKTDPRIINNKVRVRVVGDSSLWRDDVRKAAEELMEATSGFSNKTFNILLVYSGKGEIEEAMKKGGLSENLMVPESVDLIIRTGGEKRLSGMLPLQSAYAEIYFSDSFFPALTREEFESIIKWFSERKRKFGR